MTVNQLLISLVVCLHDIVCEAFFSYLSISYVHCVYILFVMCACMGIIAISNDVCNVLYVPF